MNELDLFQYYWENQNQFIVARRKDNFTGSVPVFVIKKDYEDNKNKVAEEFIIKETLKESFSEKRADELAKRIMLKLKQGGVIQ